MTTEYYCDFSAMSTSDHSLTCWTNLTSLLTVLTYMDWCCDVELVYRDETEHIVLIVTPHDYDHAEKVIQICKDCATVENMLSDVEVTAL